MISTEGSDMDFKYGKFLDDLSKLCNKYGVYTEEVKYSIKPKGMDIHYFHNLENRITSCYWTKSESKK